MEAHWKRLIPILIMNLLVASCAPRTTTNHLARGARNPYKKASPSSLSEYIRRVQTLSATNTTEAEDRRVQLLEKRPDLRELADRVTANPKDYDASKRLASEYLQQDLPASAYPLYQEAFTADPDDAEALIGLAKIWNGWGDTGSALKYAQTAVAIRPTSEGYDVLGRIYLARNNPSQAAEAFRIGLDLEPHNPVLLANTGYAFLLQSDLPSAKDYLQQAVTADGSLLEARNDLGIVLARLGNIDGALRELLKTAPEPVALNNLGVALMETQPEEAIRAFERSMQLDPSYLKPQLNLAELRSQFAPPAIMDLPPTTFEVQAPPASANPAPQEVIPSGYFAKLLESLTIKMESDLMPIVPHQIYGILDNTAGVIASPLPYPQPPAGEAPPVVTASTAPVPAELSAKRSDFLREPTVRRKTTAQDNTTRQAIPGSIRSSSNTVNRVEAQPAVLVVTSAVGGLTLLSLSLVLTIRRRKPVRTS